MKNGSVLTRIGVFYDGNYFYHVSNYYNYVHARQSRISISGLHKFIRYKVEGSDSVSRGLSHASIVDAHYFRGRLNAAEASQKGNMLYYDRVFDDILLSEGVTTHYLPAKGGNGQKMDKGIDVWLALEAFEQAFYHRVDVVVLIACDSDYVPLARKLNSLGVRVMLLSWDFEYRDDYGNFRVTKTSQDLLDVVNSPVYMDEIIDHPTEEEQSLVDLLFVSKDSGSVMMPPPVRDKGLDEEPDEYQVSSVLSIKSGYGFISFPPDNLFFHYESVVGCDFYDLKPGDKVRFKVAHDDRGEDVAVEVEPI